MALSLSLYMLWDAYFILSSDLNCVDLINKMS